MYIIRCTLEHKRGQFYLLAALVTMSTISLCLFIQDTRFYLPTIKESFINNSSNLNQENLACKFPYLDPFSSQALKYYKEYSTISCLSGLPTITLYDGDIVTVNKSLKEKYFGNSTIICWYRSLKFHRSHDYITGDWMGPFSDVLIVKDHPPFVEVKCIDEGDKIVSRMHHYITREEKRKSEHLMQSSFKDEQMNIMLIGMDSVSSHIFKRSMPRTREYLLKTMDSVELNMYNKIGDNTLPNILAIASGKYESDIPDWSLAQGFDYIPFIWKEFKAAGYRTQYISDRTDFDVFSHPPTDSYNHAMVVALMRNKIAFDNNCFEDQIEVNLWLNLIKEFAVDSLHNTGRFFSLAMIKRPTHDFPNKASAVDVHYANFLMDIFERSILNNTFLVFFSDHGPRKGAYRLTYEGSIEERAANMVIYVPLWFKQKHKHLYTNLLINANRLTTNFDIHKTLMCIAHVDFEERNTITNISSKVSRGQSLFTVISPYRTCSDTQTSPHFCLCNGGIPMSYHFHLWTSIGKQVVMDINSLLFNVRDKCETVRLQNVTSLIVLSGRPGGNGVYRVMITTNPGKAAFEATVDYSVTLWLLTTVKTLGLISRISAYKGMSDCVQNDRLLRMYCFCKNIHKPGSLSTQ